MNLTKSTPLALATIKAPAPIIKMYIVFIVRNSLACVEQPTVKPSKITTISFSAAPAVLAKRVVFPLSLRRFPKKSIPNKGIPDGTMNVVSSNPMIGNSILSV